MAWKISIQINPKEVKLQLKTRLFGKMNNIITGEHDKRDLFDAASIETSMLCYELLLDSNSVEVQANPDHVTSNIPLIHTQTHQLKCHVDSEDYRIIFNQESKHHEWIQARTFLQKLEDHTNEIMGKPTAKEREAEKEERKKDRQDRRENLELQRRTYELQEERLNQEETPRRGESKEENRRMRDRRPRRRSPEIDDLYETDPKYDRRPYHHRNDRSRYDHRGEPDRDGQMSSASGGSRQGKEKQPGTRTFYASTNTTRRPYGKNIHQNEIDIQYKNKPQDQEYELSGNDRFNKVMESQIQKNPMIKPFNIPDFAPPPAPAQTMEKLQLDNADLKQKLQKERDVNEELKTEKSVLVRTTGEEIRELQRQIQEKKDIENKCQEAIKTTMEQEAIKTRAEVASTIDYWSIKLDRANNELKLRKDQETHQLHNYTQISNEIGRIKSQYEEARQDCHNQTITNRTLQASNANLLSQVQTLTQQMAQLNEDKEESTSAIIEHREDILQMSMERDEANKLKETLETENTRIRQKLEEYQQDINQISKEKDEANHTKTTLEMENAELKQNLQKMLNEKTILENTIVGLQETVTDQEEYSKKQDEINKLQENNISRLSQENIMLETQLQTKMDQTIKDQSSSLTNTIMNNIQMITKETISPILMAKTETEKVEKQDLSWDDTGLTPGSETSPERLNSTEILYQNAELLPPTTPQNPTKVRKSERTNKGRKNDYLNNISTTFHLLLTR